MPAANAPQPLDAPQIDAELIDAEPLAEPGALVTTATPRVLATATPSPSPQALALREAAARRDPFAQALQDSLGAESRAGYLKDLRQFARWLATETGEPAPGAMAAAEVFAALTPLLELGPVDARVLVSRWLADMTRGGLSAATVNRRLAAVRWFARQAELAGAAPLGLGVLKPVKAEPRRDMAGPSGRGLGALVRQAGAASKPAAAARDRAILLLLATNGLRRGEVSRLALADAAEIDAGRLWIRGKGRGEREAVTITADTAAAIRAWLELRPAWAPAEPWAPLFCGLDNRARSRVAPVREAVALLLAGELAEVPPFSGAWWQRVTEATTPLALNGATVYRIVRGLGEVLGDPAIPATLSPHRIRHGAVTAAVRAGLSMTEAQAFARHKDPKVTQRYFDDSAELAGNVARVLGALVAAA